MGPADRSGSEAAATKTESGRASGRFASAGLSALNSGRRRLGARATAGWHGVPAWACIIGLALTATLLAGSGGSAAPATKTQLVPPFVEAARLVADDGDRQEHFGFAVAVDGNTLAVGSSDAQVGSHADQGAVYVYVRSGGGWTLQAKLTVAGGDADDHLGYAVALRGDLLVAGAPYSDHDNGAVYTFRRTGTTWTQDARLNTRTSHNGDRFGWALALSGATLAVGAPFEEQQGRTDSGAVHLFTDTPGPGGGPSSWTEADRLTASDPDSDDNFGFSVALDGDRLLAGAPSRDATAEDDGAVYAFARSAAGWSERERLTAATPDAGEHFGTAVALDGNDAVVGAPGRDGDGRDQGAAFAYAYAAGGWVRAQTLTVPAGEEHNDAEFGAAVALDAGTLAVGAPRYPSPEGNQGLVYTFSGADGAWTPRQTLISHDASRGARVGAAVAVSPTEVVAGAPDDDITTRERLTNPKQGSVTVWAEFVAADDAYTTDQGVSLSVPAPGVLANDSNPSGGTLSAQPATGPAHGTLALNGDGSFTYVPAAGFSGADAFSYHARLGATSSNLATVTITVRPRPTASPDAYSTGQDTPLTVTVATGVLANDTSGSGGPLTAHVSRGPAHGALTLAADGSFTYTPATGYSGPDAYTYTASDGGLDSLPATVSLTVHPAPPPPTANPDAYSTGQDTPLTVPAATGVLANDVSGSGGPLTAAVVTGAAHGTVALNPDGSFSYTPAAGYSGPDTFTYAAADGAGVSAAAAVSLSVTPPPPPPIANPDGFSVDQDAVLTITAPEGVLANDASGTGGALTATLVSGPAHGALILNPDGSFSYTPTAGYNGPDAFRYRASDGTGSAQANVAIAVRPPQPVVTPPAANPDSYSTGQDTPLTVTAAAGVLANDTGSTLTAAVVTGPGHGTLALNPDGSFTYTPTAGYNGPDTFTYSATNTAGSAQATATIAVQPPPLPPPTANADNYSTAHDTSLTVPAAAGVLANDAGPDLTATAATGPAHGTLTLNANGSFTYTPAAGYIGHDAFTYTATNAAGSAQATATIAVQPPPLPPPTAADDAYDTPTGTPLTIPAATGVLANDTRALAAALVAGPAHGTLALNADGSFTYTPAAGYAGSDTFTYDARNPAGADRADVALTVHPKPNHPPAAGNDAFTTQQDAPLEITAAALLSNDSDADGDPLTLADPLPLTNPDHGYLTLTPGGGLIYTPDAGFHGTDTFTYAAGDGRDSSPAATVTITVQAATPPDIPGGGGEEVIVNPSPEPPEAIISLPNVKQELRTCTVTLQATANGRQIIVASGAAQFRDRRVVRVRVKVTRDGSRALHRSIGGISVRVRAVCRAPEGEVLGTVERRLALLRIEHTVTPPGSWVPDRAALTAGGKAFLRAVIGRLRPRNVTRLRCDGHTAVAPASRVDPHALSRRRAQVVCARLRQSTLRSRAQIVAHAGGDPIATNTTETGRSANRRVGITIVYRRSRPGTQSSVDDGPRNAAPPPWIPPPTPAPPREQTPQGA